MIIYFSATACICGLLSSLAWLYASQIKFKTVSEIKGEEPWMKINGVANVDASDIENYMKKSGRVNAIAACFTGLASFFSALTIFYDKL
jgi:hypothetical protein